MNSKEGTQLIIRDPRFSFTRLLAFEVVLNLWPWLVVWGFFKAVNTDSLILLGFFSVTLSVSAVGIALKILWRTHKEPLRFAPAFVMVLFPVWTLFFIIAEWLYDRFYDVGLSGSV